jgi:hypothetical protein
VSVNDGEWHLLELAFDGSNRNFYVDGSSAGSAPVSGTLQYSSQALQVGRQDGIAGGYFSGAIDEVAFYTTTLTSSQAAVHDSVATTPTGTSCTPIGGATSSVYVPVSGDLGKRLRVEVTASDANGPSASDSLAAVVSGNAPANVSPPSIDGTAQIAQTLTAETGTWTGAGTIAYTHQWQRCGHSQAVIRDNPGATG